MWGGIHQGAHETRDDDERQEMYVWGNEGLAINQIYQMRPNIQDRTIERREHAVLGILRGNFDKLMFLSSLDTCSMV